MYEDIFKLKNEIKRLFCKLITLITWCCRLINCQKSRKELVERAKKIPQRDDDDEEYDDDDDDDDSDDDDDDDEDDVT